MLTRIRIEAEGPTISAVQEDLFATYDALCQVVYGPGRVPTFTYEDEVFESTGSPDVYHTRWYKGRVIVRFKVDEPFAIGADRLRPRTAWLADQDQRHDAGGSASTEPVWVDERPSSAPQGA